MGSGHDHSHGQPVEMVVGNDPSAYTPPNNLDFDALQGFYTDQVARLTQQVAMLVGQLSGSKQECARLNAELVKANDELHAMKDAYQTPVGTKPDGQMLYVDKSDGWRELPDAG